MFKKYVLAVPIVGILLLLPAVAVYFLAGFEWAAAFWLILFYFNIDRMIVVLKKEVDEYQKNMSSKKKNR